MKPLWSISALLCNLILGVTAATAADKTTEPPQSPHLATLQVALEHHDPNALDAFWKYVETVHTPLIEDIPDDPHHAIYTFLVRADPNDAILNVRLAASFPMATEHHTDPFTRLGDSNVWYTSYVLPKSGLLAYRIRVPKGLQPSPQSKIIFTIDGVQYEHMLDPLNPRVFGENDLHIDAPFSYFIGPEAEPSPYTDPHGAPAGALQDYPIDSAALGGKRDITIYTPAKYARSSKPLPFVLLFDAESYIHVDKVPTILDNMIAQSAIPPVIVAFVHTKETRDADLPPNENYQRFIASELMPWVRKQYPVSTDPRRNVVGGMSLGGLAAAYTAFVHPELFGKVLAESGSFWWFPNYQTAVLPNPDEGWLVKQFAESARKPVDFYITTGEWESTGSIWSIRMMHSVLLGKGNTVTYREVASGHDPINFQQVLPDGLAALLAHKAHSD